MATFNSIYHSGIKVGIDSEVDSSGVILVIVLWWDSTDSSEDGILLQDEEFFDELDRLRFLSLSFSLGCGVGVGGCVGGWYDDLEK